MLLYYLHGMHKTAAAARRASAAADLAAGGVSSSTAGSSDQHRNRLSKIEMAMQDWTKLLNHANEAAASETWELPPEELFLRILAQINKSKRDILQEKYNQCRDPSTTPAARSVFIRVLKRIAESFMSCLHNMQVNRQVASATPGGNAVIGFSAPSAAANGPTSCSAAPQADVSAPADAQ
jgi:E1A/CREB-binding protein